MFTFDSNPTEQKLILVLTLLLMFLLQSASHAQEDTSSDPQIRQLEQYVQDKNFNAAYALSGTMLEEWGGDPQFDFFAGKAAFGAGHFQEAVFAFERVLVVEPRLLPARVFLAFSYFRVNNYGAAQTELTKLLNEELPEADALQVREYLDQITKIKESAVKSHDLKVTVGYGYDSNVNSGTTADTIFFPIIGEIELLDSSRETSDEVSELALAYTYQEKLSQKRGYSVAASISDVSHQTENQLDRSIYNFSGSYYDELGNAKVNITGYIQPMTLDDDYYRIAFGTIADATWNLNENWLWMFGVGYTVINNDTNDEQDLRQYSAKTRLSYIGDTLHIFELGYGDDDAKLEAGDQNGKDFWMLNYNFIYPINPQWMLTVTASYQDIEHDGITRSFGILREEESYNAGLSLDYTPSAEWRISTRLNFSDKRSNIDIYNYDRSTAKILATHTF